MFMEAHIGTSRIYLLFFVTCDIEKLFPVTRHCRSHVSSTLIPEISLFETSAKLSSFYSLSTL